MKNTQTIQATFSNGVIHTRTTTKPLKFACASFDLSGKLRRISYSSKPITAGEAESKLGFGTNCRSQCTIEIVEVEIIKAFKA